MTHPRRTIEIELSDLTIHGLTYGEETSDITNVLCLHGWLDNANSFRPLLPLIPELNAVAIDLPGHGRSGHLNQAVPYTIASSAHYVLQTAEALGWESFHLVGHSLGGCIGPVCAIAASDRVQSLTMIDALGPISEHPDKLPDRLRRFHREMSMRNHSTARVFENIEQAVESRMKAATLEYESARLIIERQLKTTAAGLQWRFDPKLRAASPSYFTEEQVQSILSAISCPALCIVASQGYLANNKHLENRTKCVKALKVKTLPGHHHLHLDNPEPVADTISRFIQTN